MQNKVLLLLFLCGSYMVNAQVEISDSLQMNNVQTDSVPIRQDTLGAKSPMRASLYSAVVPGLGQIYNEKWWKAPIVWGLLGAGVGFTLYYNKQYKDFRGYYTAKLDGRIHDIPTGYDRLTAEQLGVIQDEKKRYRDYAVAVTTLVYILNVVDASVDAHLFGIKSDPDLAIKPTIIYDQNRMQAQYGFALNFKF